MSVTGQVGHVAFAKQVDETTPNVTANQYMAIKITGDSLVANNNMLVAEGEIGTGRDVTQAVPGGFAAAGAINGNFRARAGAVLLQGALGTRTEIVAVGGTSVAHDKFTPTDDLPSFSVEKKVGTTDPQLLVLRYDGVMVNTLNVSVNSGGLSTFSAGLIAKEETKLVAGVATIAYPASGDDLLVFHGGRIRSATTGTTLTSSHDKATFQSVELVVNNNIQADEYTIRPSRFLRSLTEGIRSVEANLTIVFEDDTAYEEYTYGAAGRTTPGYSLYYGALEMSLANWQLIPAESIIKETPTGAPALPQGLKFDIPKLAFSGLPVALASGRIAVSTTARALKPTGNIIEVLEVPQRAGLDYA